MHLPAAGVPPEDAPMTKDELRREMRLRLRSLRGREEKSRALAEVIAVHPAFARSGQIAIFAPLPSEPDVELLWEKRSSGFCYPRVVGSEIEFISAHSLADLKPSPWHPAVREPAAADARIVAPEEISLLLVPGLAFTRDGHRLGRGGGFYDRFLARLPASAFKIGVCFDLQVVASLATESHDQLVNAVATESGLLLR